MLVTWWTSPTLLPISSSSSSPMTLWRQIDTKFIAKKNAIFKQSLIFQNIYFWIVSFKKRNMILFTHFVSSSGSGGGGVLGLRSNNGFFGFKTDWSTVPDASAANILETYEPSDNWWEWTKEEYSKSICIALQLIMPHRIVCLGTFATLYMSNMKKQGCLLHWWWKWKSFWLPFGRDCVWGFEQICSPTNHTIDHTITETKVVVARRRRINYLRSPKSTLP